MTLVEEFQLRFGASASADDLAQFVREKSQVASNLKVPGSTSTALYSGRTGAATHQRHQASADHIVMNEGADMAIRYDRENRRAIDEETGEFLVPGPFYFDAPTRRYDMHAADGSVICSGEVKRRDVDTTGDKTVDLIVIDIVSMTSKIRDREFVSIEDSSSAIVQRFVSLLEVLAAGPINGPPVVQISSSGLGREAGR